ncbi:MAG: FAD:protein FMN transferase [Acutalibacteraceae bacterium]
MLPTKKPAKKAKKILVSVTAVIAAIAIIVSVIIIDKRKEEYPSDTKSSVAMGTIVTVKVYGEKAAAHTDSISKMVSSVEDIISRKIETSPVSILNKTGKTDNEMVASLLEICNSVSKDSGGVFDVSIGEVSSLWDFDDEKNTVPEEEDINAALQTVDYTKIKIDGSEVSVGKNQQIDLGAVGKGYACDVIKAYLQEAGVDGAVVSVGGSILAYGKRNDSGDKWRIAVRDPENESGYIGTVLLDEGFVSTSGDYEKYFEKDGKRYHHILDAKTGYPSESDLRSVTVVCDSGALSDALSTACFILGEEKSQTLLSKYGASAVFIDKDMNITTYGDIEFKEAK